jgi:hypothetical protein
MNQRLATEYDMIESKNRGRVLANEILVDTTWGKEIFGVTLQIDLSDAVKDMVCQYQSDLGFMEPGNMLLLPREYQHLSFNQVVFWGREYAEGTAREWNRIAEGFTSAFLKLDMNYMKFDVQFSRLIATTGGIIWCATDANDELEQLRDDVFGKLPFPDTTTKRNTIIHTTVARFQKPLLDPTGIVEYCRNHNQSVTMAVSSIVLRKELVYPSIKTEEIARITLL